jgi:two-component system sensor histidine kinase/response regulator
MNFRTGHHAGFTSRTTMPTRILLVEDNKDLRENATLVLHLEGYEVQAASDGREALELIETGFVPQLIVSDIMMPRMDGYRFFEAVRQKRSLRSVPFIFLTARGSRQDVSTGRMLGADDYLIKPFDPEELLIAIQTRLRRTAEIRADADEDLAQARRHLADLLSHELRTPLTYVTGGFALLADELKHHPENSTSDHVRTSLDLIQNGTQRLNRLAEQMVLYSQLISGDFAQRLQSSGENLELLFLILDARDEVGHLARERGITLRQNLPETEILTVYGLRDLLVTAMSEIIRNALQYSARGTQVRLTLAREGPWALFTVSDEGNGIRSEDQANIWNVLIQSERDFNQQQGAGMGLPIVKGIIITHGGEVKLDSAPGLGTRVTVRLPLVFD